MVRILRRKMRRALLGIATLLLGASLAAPVDAQQATPTLPQQATPTPGQQAATQPAKSLTPRELAKSVRNPFEKFVTLPIQSTTGFSIGPHHNAGEDLNVQPLIPLFAGTRWDLIARPSLDLTYLPSPHEQFGLGDLQTSFFLTPHRVSAWIWGAGPILQFPTATADELGTGRWSAGPTAALVYSKGPWFNGVLAYHLMSFAGDRSRGSVNQTYLEPEVSYNFESGWYVDCDPAITFDWTANEANGWTIPMGADFGKAFRLGSRAMGFQAGAYDLLKRPNGTAQWIIRVQMTALFPEGR